MRFVLKQLKNSLRNYHAKISGRIKLTPQSFVSCTAIIARNSTIGASSGSWVIIKDSVLLVRSSPLQLATA